MVFMVLLWAATMWGLHIEFRAQRYRDRAKPESCRGPVVDHDYMAYWRSGAAGQPAIGCDYAEREGADLQDPAATTSAR